MRIVSLVPSLTEAVAALGRADALVGVTRWCEIGAPDGAARIGGTKNPDVVAVVALAPDLVLANTEENRAEDLAALRAAGLAVHETFPRRSPTWRRCCASWAPCWTAAGARAAGRSWPPPAYTPPRSSRRCAPRARRRVRRCGP